MRRTFWFETFEEAAAFGEAIDYAGNPDVTLIDGETTLYHADGSGSVTVEDNRPSAHNHRIGKNPEPYGLGLFERGRLMRDGKVVKHAQNPLY